MLRLVHTTATEATAAAGVGAVDGADHGADGVSNLRCH